MYVLHAFICTVMLLCLDQHMYSIIYVIISHFGPTLLIAIYTSAQLITIKHILLNQSVVQT